MRIQSPICVLGILLIMLGHLTAQVTEETLRKLEQRHRQEIEQIRKDLGEKIAKLQSRVHELEQVPKAGPGQEDDELARLIAAAEQESGAINESLKATVATGGAGKLNAFNPRITVFSDTVLRSVRGTLRNGNGDDIGDRFSLRETEIDFRADVDPFAKAVFIFSIEEDSPGQFSISPEEVYATFETLPFNLRAKVGRFRTAFGANNVLHTHDLPQTDRPLAVRSFLGDEGDMETGVSLQWLIPGIQNPALKITGQVVNGENDKVLAGALADNLAYLGRVEAFFETSSTSWLSVGTSALFGRSSSQRTDNSVLLGADLTFKWRPDDERQLDTSLVAQAEGFYLSEDVPGGETTGRAGAYGMLLYQVGRRWYLGVRGDWTEFPEDGNDAWSASAWVSYYTTEFLRLRLGFEYLDEPSRDADMILFLQLTVVIGSHPAEPFWVNR